MSVSQHIDSILQATIEGDIPLKESPEIQAALIIAAEIRMQGELLRDKLGEVIHQLSVGN